MITRTVKKNKYINEIFFNNSKGLLKLSLNNNKKMKISI